MINYLNILKIWEVIEKVYEPKYNPDINILTTKSLMKKENDNVVNAILNSLSEGVALLFDNMTNTNKI
jgi:hypothetical protein